MAVPDVNESYYESDEIMAELGRQIIDQYVFWCRKYDEPVQLSGWGSSAKTRILAFIEGDKGDDQ